MGYLNGYEYKINYNFLNEGVESIFLFDSGTEKDIPTATCSAFRFGSVFQYSNM